MKKLLLFFFAFALLHNAMGQQWNITLGNESKSLSYNRSSVIQRTGFIGSLDNTIYLMRFTDERKSKPYLVAYDRDLNEKGRVELPAEKEKTLYGGFANEGSIDLLMTESTDEVYNAYRLSFDPQTLQKKNEHQLASFKKGKDRKNFTFVGTSQSQEWLSIMFALVQDNDAEWVINLYDTQLEELWSMDFHMDVIDDYMVTDSGEVLLGGFYNKKNSDDIRLEFAVLDGESEARYSDVGQWEDMQTMEIVRYDGGKIYCTGLLRGEELEKNGSRWSSGFYSLVYDTREKRVTLFEKKVFTKEDVCDLCNVSHRNRMKVVSTDKLSFVNAVCDNDGTVVEFERSYNLLVNHVPTFTAYMGVLVYRIDNAGHIVWQKIINREVQTPAEATNAVNSKLFVHDGKYTMFYMEDPKNLEAKPDTPLKPTSTDKAKQILLALTFDKQGNVSRQALQIPSKAFCIGAPHLLADGSYMLFLSQQFKSYVAILKYL